jgi:hypothetical protein
VFLTLVNYYTSCCSLSLTKGFTSFPWYIRSDFAGNVFVNSDGVLQRFNPSRTEVWRSSAMPTLFSLHVSDDESTLVLTNTTHVLTLSSETGSLLGAASHPACLSQVSPWATPVMLLGAPTAVAVACPSPSWHVEVYEVPSAKMLFESKPISIGVQQVRMIISPVILMNVGPC